MFTTNTVRLYPTPAQERTLSGWLRCAAKVWNHFLEHRIKVYKRRGEFASRFDQFGMLTLWRASDVLMKAVPLRVQRDAIDRLDLAFAAFFSRIKSGERPGFPRFKSWRCWSSISFNEGASVKAGCARIPKLGRICCRGLREITGTIKTLRIIRRASGWYAQLVIDDGLSLPEKKPVESAVGIDVGLESFATLSTGKQIENPRHGRRLGQKVARSQRRLKRMQKGSQRRRKQVLRSARVHERIANSRRDHAHKTSRRLVDQFDLIAVEKLNIAGLGRTKLAKSIYDAAWGGFHRCLTYKAANAGKQVVEVDPRGTSQECFVCGRIVKKALSQRRHQCECGVDVHRDHNSAKVILVRAVGPNVQRVERPTSGRRSRKGSAVDAPR